MANISHFEKEICLPPGFLKMGRACLHHSCDTVKDPRWVEGPWVRGLGARGTSSPVSREETLSPHPHL